MNLCLASASGENKTKATLIHFLKWLLWLMCEEWAENKEGNDRLFQWPK